MKKTIFLALLIVAVLSFGCGAKSQHPSDIAGNIIVPFDKGYQIAERSLLALHDFCAALGSNCPAKLQPIVTNWNTIDDKNDQISAQVDKVHALWLTVSRLKTPETERQLKEQLDVLTRLFDELMAFIPKTEETTELRNHIQHRVRYLKIQTENAYEGVSR